MGTGKQKEMIELAKRRAGTWKELSSALGHNECYLKNELGNEKRIMSEGVYDRLCRLLGRSYDDSIEERLDENWGRRKGARMSPRTKVKEVGKVEASGKLAEIVGIMLGDGNIYRKQYAVRVCGHINDDRDYLIGHVKSVFMEVFNVEMKEYYHKSVNELILYVYSKFVASNLKNYGMVDGNKKSKGSRIPSWILENEDYTKNCLRGLFDTDGCVFTSKGKVKIEFYSAIEPLQESFTVAMQKMGFKKKWSKSKGSVKTYGLYSADDVRRFINTIGFNNPKHKAKCLDSVAA